MRKSLSHKTRAKFAAMAFTVALALTVEWLFFLFDFEILSCCTILIITHNLNITIFHLRSVDGEQSSASAVSWERDCNFPINPLVLFFKSLFYLLSLRFAIDFFFSASIFRNPLVSAHSIPQYSTWNIQLSQMHTETRRFSSISTIPTRYWGSASIQTIRYISLFTAFWRRAIGRGCET